MRFIFSVLIGLGAGGLVIVGIYLISFYGIFKKKAWGSIIIMIFSVVDIMIALAIMTELSSAQLFGAVFMDVLLAGLAYREYNILASNPSRKKRKKK